MMFRDFEILIYATALPPMYHRSVDLRNLSCIRRLPYYLRYCYCYYILTAPPGNLVAHGSIFRQLTTPVQQSSSVTKGPATMRLFLRMQSSSQQASALVSYYPQLIFHQALSLVHYVQVLHKSWDLHMTCFPDECDGCR